MKKIVGIVVLMLVIVLSFGFVAAKIMAQGDENNYFNTHWRAKAAAYPWLRQVLGLHWDGDGRADYLGPRYQKIFMEVDLLEGQEIELSALDSLVKKMESITGKETAYLISDRQTPKRNYRNTGDTAVVYLQVLDRDSESPDTLGSTFEEYGVILYGSRLREFTASSPRTLNNYTASTALHEFGHLLGLPHNEQAGCLMNEHAEEAQVARERPQDVVTDFCQYEKDLIWPVTTTKF